MDVAISINAAGEVALLIPALNGPAPSIALMHGQKITLGSADGPAGCDIPGEAAACLIITPRVLVVELASDGRPVRHRHLDVVRLPCAQS